MPREDAAAKGRRYLAEGRLRVTSIGADTISATALGDSGEVYGLGWDPQSWWWCTCPAKSRCAHLTALQLVTIRPGAGALRNADGGGPG